MKNILFILFTALAILGIMPSEMIAQASTDRISNAQIVPFKSIALDSSLANSGTKYTRVFPLLTKSSDFSKTQNFLHGASVSVMATQTNDSVNADIYLQIGAITGGTLGQTYAEILIDSLRPTKKSAIIPLGGSFSQTQTIGASTIIRYVKIDTLKTATTADTITTGAITYTRSQTPSYLFQSEGRIVVKAKSAGNGFQAKWSSAFSGVGYSISP